VCDGDLRRASNKHVDILRSRLGNVKVTTIEGLFMVNDKSDYRFHDGSGGSNAPHMKEIASHLTGSPVPHVSAVAVY
jgi:hypothetical protein